MKVWVLGAGGLLGRALVAALDDEPHLATGHEVDVGDAPALARRAIDEGVTHVINAAAFAQVDACETAGDVALRANAEGPGNVAAAAAAAGAAVVHVSTDYVFDGAAREPYSEDAARDPINAYGRGKRDGEDRFWGAARGRAYVVRTSWLFGAGRPSFVRTMLRLGAERDELRVVADQQGRPTYAPDLAGAILALCRSTAQSGNYHFANAGVTTWHAFAEAILDEARAQGLPVRAARVVPIATADYPTPACRPAYSVLSTDKIERALGLHPRPWREALVDGVAALAAELP